MAFETIISFRQLVFLGLDDLIGMLKGVDQPRLAASLGSFPHTSLTLWGQPGLSSIITRSICARDQAASGNKQEALIAHLGG
jgi:hypothetical protein